jgi:hypothetical protein
MSLGIPTMVGLCLPLDSDYRRDSGRKLSSVFESRSREILIGVLGEWTFRGMLLFLSRSNTFIHLAQRGAMKKEMGRAIPDRHRDQRPVRERELEPVAA